MFWFPRATMSDRKAVIKNADMSEDMQQDAVECATQALEKYNIEKDIAAFIKKVKQMLTQPTYLIYVSHCITFPHACMDEAVSSNPVHHSFHTPSLVLPVVTTLTEETCLVYWLSCNPYCQKTQIMMYHLSCTPCSVTYRTFYSFTVLVSGQQDSKKCHSLNRVY